MPAVSIIADGATDNASADITINDGSSATFSLRTSAAEPIARVARAFIQQKDSAGNYRTIGTLSAECPSISVAGPIVVRVQRTANAVGVSYGVDQS